MVNAMGPSRDRYYSSGPNSSRLNPTRQRARFSLTTYAACW